MKLLFLTYRFPYPADRGDRLTVFHLLRTFHAAGHEVTLVTFVDGSEPAESMERVAPFCARVETVHLPKWRSWLQAWLGLPRLQPSQVSYFESARMSALLERLNAETKFDLVFSHLIRMAPYGAALDHPLKVLWIGDSLGLALARSMPFAPFWRRPGIAWERLRVDRFTGLVSRNFQDCWALSLDDLEDQKRLGVRQPTLVIHGVDERLFALERAVPATPRVVFLGNLSVPHNIDAAIHAAQDVWPLVRARAGEATLVLAGADPVPSVRRLGELPGVTVTGPLPDLLDLWRNASVMIAPLRFSTGIQNKVLEPMAAGVPVVTTRRVADALGAVDGEHLLTAEDPQGFADSVLRVLAEPGAAAERAERARRHVHERFSWNAAIRRCETLVAQARR
ncbi:MAG: glycosyltransferase [Candidatus Eisenbacteria bacterium]|uniref:Glycosyltransferase n=1 Tax=Eiseniibacteriota bacterium TaxID=2212470 RepID=A0A933WA07_UNCEI|nr:glycosyltransferase [Candidatus Eisenbacteria bacterium]